MGFKTALCILNVYHLINSERAAVAKDIFTHQYAIDDAIDGALPPIECRHLLTNERIEIQKGRHKQSKYEHLNYVHKVAPKTNTQIFNYLESLIDAFKYDVEIRETQEPLPEKQLRVKTKLAVHSSFNLAFSFIHDKVFQEPKELAELTYHWTIYDALKDLKEDVSHNLYLLPAEKLIEYSIQKNNLDTYSALKADLKKETSQKMYELSSIFKYSNLNTFEQLTLQCYFLSRSFKARLIQ